MEAHGTCRWPYRNSGHICIDLFLNFVIGWYGIEVYTYKGAFDSILSNLPTILECREDKIHPVGATVPCFGPVLPLIGKFWPN